MGQVNNTPAQPAPTECKNFYIEDFLAASVKKEDKSQPGALTAAQVIGIEAELTSIDSNGDKIISKDEVDAFYLLRDDKSATYMKMVAGKATYCVDGTNMALGLRYGKGD